MHLEDGVLAMDTFRLPRHFWKLVVVRRSRGGLGCAAYLVANSEGTDRSSKAPAFSTLRVPLSDLEKRAGLKFASALHKAVDLDCPKAPKGRG